MIEANFVYIHGLNTSNNKFSEEWQKAINDIVLRANPEIKANHFPVKWSSTSWMIDLQNIYMYKKWRDSQINKVIEQIKNCGGKPTFVISHSWGSVWAYKAIMRMSRSCNLPENIYM